MNNYRQFGCLKVTMYLASHTPRGAPRNCLIVHLLCEISRADAPQPRSCPFNGTSTQRRAVEQRATMALVS